MTTPVIVFEILFLILIANPSNWSSNNSGQQATAKASSAPPQRVRRQVFGGENGARNKSGKPPSSGQREPKTSGRLQDGRLGELYAASAQIVPTPNNKSRADDIYLNTTQEFRTKRARRRRRFKRAAGSELTLVASPSGLSQGLDLMSGTSSQQSPPTPPTPPPTQTQPQSPRAELPAAELCYLADGGSSLTLTVNEATRVGAVIGTIEVNGDPALEGGNVELVDGLEQATGAAASAGEPASGPLNAPSPTGTTTTTATASHRQGNRLFGRREAGNATPADGATSSGQQHPQTAAGAFYALVGAPPVAAQREPAIRVVPGTKNLVLARALDKESAEGESSQLVNVRCRPRTSEPQLSLAASRRQTAYTTIPIKLIVTDANDHAPEFVGPLPYVLNISETTPAGSVVSRDIQAIDRDSAGPHSTIHYRVLDAAPGAEEDSLDSGGEQAQRPQQPLAALFAFTNPLEPVLSLTGALDYESLASGSFTFFIAAQDQAEPEPLQSVAQVRVNVLDFDDHNPRFLDEKYTLVMDESQSSLVGQTLRVLPRNLRAEDGDRGINAPVLYSFDARQLQSAAGEQHLAQDPGSNVDQFLHLNPTSGELRLIRQWPAGRLPLTLVVRATQADNRDRYALTTLTIVRSAPQAGVSHNSEPGLSVAATNSVGAQISGGQRDPLAEAIGDVGALPRIAFERERVLVQVAEDAPVNEKIARVKAVHLPATFAGATSERGAATATDSTSAGSPKLNAGHASGGPAPNNTQATGSAEDVSAARPINYQILDDQTDQFGINGLGEIFLKRPLDFEQRREFKFRVLATYTKHSDICHVQLLVLNVNDNKPKFAQSHYSFHLTESRLRSNFIGLVQAHDNDLNDTLHYSALPANGEQQQCARLFEVSAGGALSLRAGVRQLNASQCQLLVQASDSLGPIASRHQQQARVSVYVAAQLLGRALSLGAPADELAATPAAGQEPEARLFNAAEPTGGASAPVWPPRKSSRDFSPRLLKPAADAHLSPANRQQVLSAAESATSLTTAAGARGFGLAADFPLSVISVAPAPSSQRSSLATVMASMQHMAKSINFFEMPMSSALLLSVLLTLLVCLLLIVIISMSVHVYRRRNKTRRHHHHHLTAVARLRHAQMAAAAAAAGETGAGGASSARSASASSGAGSSSSSSSPANGSPTSPFCSRQTSAQSPRSLGTKSLAKQNRVKLSTAGPKGARSGPGVSSKNARQFYDNLALSRTSEAPSSAQALSGGEPLAMSRSRTKACAFSDEPLATVSGSLSGEWPTNSRSSLASSCANDSTPHPSGLSPELSGCGARQTPAASSVAVQAAYLRVDKQQHQSRLAQSKHFEALQIAIAGCGEQNGPALALNKKRGDETYLRTVTLASSTAPTSTAPDMPAPPQATAQSKHNPLYAGTPESGTGGGGTKQTDATKTRFKSPLGSYGSAPLSSDGDDDDDDNSSAANYGHYSVNGTMEHKPPAPERVSGGQRARAHAGQASAGQSGQSAEESRVESRAWNGRESLETAIGKLVAGERSRRPVETYRPLASLGRAAAAASNSNRVAPMEEQRTNEQAAGLMAIIRDARPPLPNGPTERNQQIKWPSESIPQRIKRLTWDDELSCTGDNESLSLEVAAARQRDEGRASNAAGHRDDEVEFGAECYISPDVQIGSPSLDRALHRYEAHADAGDKQSGAAVQQAQFLFSLSSHMLPSLNQHQSDDLQLIGAQPPALQARASSNSAASFYSSSAGGRCAPGYATPASSCAPLPQLAGVAAANEHHQQNSLRSQANNQNNCLDYTIVDSSQFHVDSLAGAVSERRQAAPTAPGGGSEPARDYFAGDYFARSSRGVGKGGDLQQANCRQSAANAAQADDFGSSLTSTATSTTGQTNVTFKLNQNYQDLKLMTTAIL